MTRHKGLHPTLESLEPRRLYSTVAVFPLAKTPFNLFPAFRMPLPRIGARLEFAGPLLQPLVAPIAPTAQKVSTLSNTNLRVKWGDSSSDETGFVIERSIDGNAFTQVGSVAANVASFDDSSLVPNTKYYYRVYGVGSGGNSAFSDVMSNLTLPTFTRTVWVDPAYVGTENGAYATPYNTVAEAMNTLTGTRAYGAGIVLRDGIYTETVTMKSGATGQPLTLMGAPGERARLSGFAAIGQGTGTNGWTPYAGRLYVTTLNWKPDTLYVDDTRQVLSRTPNEGWWNSVSITTNTAAGTVTISDPADLAGGNNLTGSYFQAHESTGNTYFVAQVLSHNQSAGTITIPYGSSTSGNLRSGDPFVVKNQIEMIDQPGEWAIVNGPGANYTLYFWPKSAADLSKTQAQFKTGRNIYVGSGTKNVVIRDLEVYGNQDDGLDVVGSVNAGGTFTPAGTVVVTGVLAHDNGNAGILVRYAENVTVSYSRSLANNNGMFLSSVIGLDVEQNEVAYNDLDGIDLSGDVGVNPTKINSSNVYIQKNYIHHQLGWGHTDGVQLYSNVSDAHILNNVILDGSQGIHMEQSTSGEIAGNIIWGSFGYSVTYGHSNTFDWNTHNNTLGGSNGQIYNITGSGFAMNENIAVGQILIPSVTSNAYTGNRNLLTNPWGNAVFIVGTSSYSSVALFYSRWGQDQNSVSANPGFANVPLLTVAIDNNKVGLANPTTLYLQSVTGFAPGDKIEINNDGVVRTVATVNTTTKVITFSPALPVKPSAQYMIVSNWKTQTNFALDFTLEPTSPGVHLGATGGPVGATINFAQFVSGDFNGDHVIDLSNLPADVLAGLPDPNNWPLPTFAPLIAAPATDTYAPALTAVSSRKSYGASGRLDLPITLNAASPMIEPRAGGATQLVFNFSEPIRALDGTLNASEFTLTNAAFGSAIISGQQLTLNLTSVVDTSRMTVTLRGLADAAGNALAGTTQVTIRNLLGDVNQDGSVDAADVSAVSIASGTFVNTNSSRNVLLLDLNNSGAVNAVDVVLAKSKLGNTLS